MCFAEFADIATSRINACTWASVSAAVVLEAVMLPVRHPVELLFNAIPAACGRMAEFLRPQHHLTVRLHSLARPLLSKAIVEASCLSGLRLICSSATMSSRSGSGTSLSR